MWRKIKLNLLAGLLVLLPMYLTYLILLKLFLLIDGIFNRMATRALVATLNLPLNEDQIIYGLGIIALFAVIQLAGSLTRNYLGKRLIVWFNLQMDQIPIVRNIYKTLRQILNALFSANREAFQKPVLIEYPRQGLYSLAFQTQSSGGALQGQLPEDCITVFLPHTPNPTTGFVLFVPKTQVREVALSVEDAKYVKTVRVLTGEALYSHAWLEI